MSTPESVPSLPFRKNTNTSLARLFSSSADNHIAHLNRILSTASGVDSTLLLVGYTLTLVHSQLNNLLDLNLRAIALRIAKNASTTLLPGETVLASIPAPAYVSRIATLHSTLKSFAGICSDVRAFLRLWGLLGIWAWARNTYFDGPKDSVLRGVAWAQITVNALYLIYEHPAYLASKGVLKGWSADRQTRWWLRSNQFFAGHVALDYIRLWRVKQLRERERENQALAEEKEEKIERERQEAMWWKELYVNVAYTPLVLHWSLEGGFVNDTWVGLLGTWAGVLGFREVWRQTS